METSDDAELYVVVCLLGVLSVLGTTGNLVVLYVFSRPAKHERGSLNSASSSSSSRTQVLPSASATVYVITLAVADLVTCLLGIPFTVFMEWAVFRTPFDVFCKFYQVCLQSMTCFNCVLYSDIISVRFSSNAFTGNYFVLLMIIIIIKNNRLCAGKHKKK